MLATLALSLSTPTPAGAATQRALLVGINEYQALPDLGGAVNDVRLLREILVQRFGFPADQVRVITDEQATRKGLLAALKTLVDESEPGDLVYFHYSGHGSQANDRNGDEPEGMDETLVPHDGRTRRIPDILDDELARILGKLDAEQTVVVLDSCHSGTATRGGSFAVRRVEADDRDALYETTATRAVVPLAQEDYVLLTGAASNQEALDGPIDGRAHGLFSYALARSMIRNGPRGSARQVFSGVEMELERIKGKLGLSAMPEPQLEAREARIERPLFSIGTPDAAATQPWVSAVRLGEGAVRLVDATKLGATAGSTWAVYGASEREFRPGSALAEAVVTRIEGLDAVARLEPVDIATPAGARAILVAEASLGGPTILLEGDAPEALRDALSAAIPGVQLVDDAVAAQYIVRVGEGHARLLGAGGLVEIATIVYEKPAELADELASILERTLAAAELLALDNPAATLTLALRAESDERATTRNAAGNLTLRAGGETRYTIRRPGEARTEGNSLRIGVLATDPCYLTLFDVDSEGNLNRLFPNPISEQRGFLPDGRIPANEWTAIPDSLESTNRAGFHFDYVPPAGIDTVRGFCATNVEISNLLRSALRPEGVETRGLGQEIETLQRQLAQVRSRGIAVVTAEPAAETSESPEPEADAQQADAPDAPAPPQEAAATTPEKAEPSKETGGGDWTAASLIIRVDAAPRTRVSPTQEQAENGIRFIDSSTFDSSLREALADEAAPTTTVTFEGPMSVNALPPRLDRWLAAVVKRGDGSISVEPDPTLPETRSLALIGVGLVVAKQAYDWVRTYHLYAPAKQYDVVIYVQPGTSNVTRAVFVRKPTEEPQT